MYGGKTQNLGSAIKLNLIAVIWNVIDFQPFLPMS
jgi:hypothetical protein